MHYAVPKILESAGLLHRFYTDIYADSRPLKYLRCLIPNAATPSSLKALFDRKAEGISNEKIESFPVFGLHSALRARLISSLAEKTAEYLREGRHFGRLVTAKLSPEIDAVYAFKSAALEILEWCNSHGVLTVVEQPSIYRPAMHRLVSEERETYPDWSLSEQEDHYAEKQARRDREEWDRADLIICPSNFVQQGIEEGGGPVERTIVVPYGVDFTSRSSPRAFPSRPLRVLTVGTIGLHKGAVYLMQAARNSEATFRAVGTVNLSACGRRQLAHSVDLRGRVPRSEIHKHYEWADVFLLPSLCEGSATVTYEALAYALPVICTPNTGSIVRDQREGFIVPIRDAASIVDCIEQLSTDASLYEQMSSQALRRYNQEGSVQAYGKRLVDAIGHLAQT